MKKKKWRIPIESATCDRSLNAAREFWKHFMETVATEPSHERLGRVSLDVKTWYSGEKISRIQRSMCGVGRHESGNSSRDDKIQGFLSKEGELRLLPI